MIRRRNQEERKKSLTATQQHVRPTPKYTYNVHHQAVMYPTEPRSRSKAQKENSYTYAQMKQRDILKRDYLYEESQAELNISSISLNRSRQEPYKYHAAHLNGQDVNDYSPRQLNNTLQLNTSLQADYEHTHQRRRSHEPTQEDLQAKYEQIWNYNQQFKDRNTRNQQQNQLLDLDTNCIDLNRTAMIVNSRPSLKPLSRNYQQQPRSTLTRQHRHIVSPEALCNFPINPADIAAIQTRPTSPLHIRSVKPSHDATTLRSSPIRREEADCRLRLLDEFSAQVSARIREVTSTLEQLRGSRR